MLDLKSPSKEFLDNNKSYLYADVGGGSTELTLYHKGKVIIQKSFIISRRKMLTQ